MPKDDSSAEGQKWGSSVPRRVVIAVMCFLGLCTSFAIRTCLSIAITVMVSSPTKSDIIEDDTCSYDDIRTFVNSSSISENASRNYATKETYDWSEYTQGIILSSFYWVYWIAQPLSGPIAEKYGGKHTMGFGLLIAAILTILTPPAIYIGDSTALIVVRAVMGLGESIVYPAVIVLLAKWTPPEERSRTVAFVYSGLTIGTIFATTLSGWILQYSSVGWPLVFYVIGGIGVLWYLMWLTLCYNSPQDHPFINQKEVKYLEERMQGHTHHEPPPIPWRHILASKPVWALIIAMIGQNWVGLSINTDLPKYMSGVLKFSVENNGYFTSLLYLFLWLTANTTSWVVDYLIAKKNLSRTLVRKVSSFIALPVSTAFILAASYAGCDRTLAIAMFAASMILVSFVYPSLFSNTLDLSPNHAGTIMAFANGVSSFTGIFGPYVIGVLTPNQTMSEWKLVFWIMFVVVTFCDLIFLVYGSGEVQFWNHPESIQIESDEKKRQEYGSQRFGTVAIESSIE